MVTVDVPKDKKGEIPIQGLREKNLLLCFWLREKNGNASAVAQGSVNKNYVVVLGPEWLISEQAVAEGEPPKFGNAIMDATNSFLVTSLVYPIRKEISEFSGGPPVDEMVFKGDLFARCTFQLVQESLISEVAILDPPASLLFGGSKFQGIEVTRSATQMFEPYNIGLVRQSFEIGSSSVAQPPPSAPSAAKKVRRGRRIPIIVIVWGRQADQQRRYTVHVEPDEQVFVLRQLLANKCNVAYLPQHYSFAFKREVMNEDLSFREHGIVSMGGTKIEVVDFPVDFPPHHFAVIG